MEWEIEKNKRRKLKLYKRGENLDAKY